MTIQLPKIAQTNWMARKERRAITHLLAKMMYRRTNNLSESSEQLMAYDKLREKINVY